MAECKTCGATIEVPEGWSVGPAVRRHYWEAHPERMQKTRADEALPPAKKAGRKKAKPAGGGGCLTGLALSLCRGEGPGRPMTRYRYRPVVPSVRADATARMSRSLRAT